MNERADSDIPSPLCPRCGGQTIQFRGLGLDTEYKLCPNYLEPGHKTIEECRVIFTRMNRLIFPSGRVA